MRSIVYLIFTLTVNCYKTCSSIYPFFSPLFTLVRYPFLPSHWKTKIKVTRVEGESNQWMFIEISSHIQVHTNVTAIWKGTHWRDMQPFQRMLAIVICSLKGGPFSNTWWMESVNPQTVLLYEIGCISGYSNSNILLIWSLTKFD